MARFLLRRVLQAIPVLLIVITATFFLVRLAPGGPFDAERDLPPDTLQRLNAHYHLDQPVAVQYLIYLKGLARGDLGPSFRFPNRTVSEMIASGLPITLELAFYALLVALLLGIGAGIAAALRPHGAGDHLAMGVALVGICVPAFLLGPLLSLVFSIHLEWLPVSGWGYAPGDKVLPSLTLGVAYAAYIARLTRGGMLETMSQDFIRTARAKGASSLRVVTVHALRGGLLPTVAFLGPATAGLLSGSFVIETVFGIPGIGRFFVQAAFNRDYTMIMGTTIFFAALILVLNLLSDIVQAALDPRMRLGA